MADRVEVVVKVHCGAVLGDEFAAMFNMRPTMHFDNHFVHVNMGVMWLAISIGSTYPNYLSIKR